MLPCTILTNHSISDYCNTHYRRDRLWPCSIAWVNFMEQQSREFLNVSTRPISHNTPFKTEICTFLFWIVYCETWERFIMGFARLIYELLPDIVVPGHMEFDVWTRSPSGCACLHDPSSQDCACCEEGGCQCGSAQPYQCVRCGHEDNQCGLGMYRSIRLVNKVILMIAVCWERICSESNAPDACHNTLPGVKSNAPDACHNTLPGVTFWAQIP